LSHLPRADRHAWRPAERCADVPAERPEHRDGQREPRGATCGDRCDSLERRGGLRQGYRGVRPAASDRRSIGSHNRVAEETTMLLVGDIGGTKTDLALFSADRGSRTPMAQKRFSGGEYPSLEACVREFVANVSLPVTRACFIVAGSVIGGRAALT